MLLVTLWIITLNTRRKNPGIALLSACAAAPALLADLVLIRLICTGGNL